MNNTKDSTLVKTPTRAFGIGCFDFRLDRRPPYTLTSEDQANAIGAALKTLNSLSDLSIEYQTALSETFEIDEEIPQLEDGGRFPGLPYGQISFSLFIPTRIQKELVLGGIVSTETETFRLVIRHMFYGPIAFVECVNGGSTCDASQGVEVVVKFLEKEFSKPKSGVIFECMGPSPFHMDFYVQESADVEDFSFTQIPLMGYDRVELKAGFALESPDALDWIFQELGLEIDTFYHIVRQRVIQINGWAVIQGQWEHLRDLVGTQTFGNLKLKIQVHTAARNLITDAFAFTAGLSIARQEGKNCLATMYEKKIQYNFKAYLEAEQAGAFPDYPTQALIDWATHIHTSSFKFAEIMTVVCSALLGGLVGSLLTAMLAAPLK